MRFLVDIYGDLEFIFSKAEMINEEEELCFSLVMKFMQYCPSIDKIRLSIVRTWGVMKIPTISVMEDTIMC